MLCWEINIRTCVFGNIEPHSALDNYGPPCPETIVPRVVDSNLRSGIIKGAGQISGTQGADSRDQSEGINKLTRQMQRMRDQGTDLRR